MCISCVYKAILDLYHAIFVEPLVFLIGTKRFNVCFYFLNWKSKNGNVLIDKLILKETIASYHFQYSYSCSIFIDKHVSLTSVSIYYLLNISIFTRSSLSINFQTFCTYVLIYWLAYSCWRIFMLLLHVCMLVSFLLHSLPTTFLILSNLLTCFMHCNFLDTFQNPYKFFFTLRCLSLSAH